MSHFSEESAELLKKSVRKSKKLDDNQSEITEDEPQVVSKIVKMYVL